MTPAGVHRQPHPSGLSISESVTATGPGTWIHVSGQIPLDGDGTVLVGDPRAEAVSVFDQLDGALRRAGAELSDVVKLTVFLTDLGRLGDVNAERAERFGDRPPASSAVQVGALFGGAQLEVEAVAFCP